MITHLPWLKENDFLLTPIDTFSLKIKKILSEAKEISVFVSKYNFCIVYNLHCSFT